MFEEQSQMQRLNIIDDDNDEDNAYASALSRKSVCVEVESTQWGHVERGQFT